jgi:hypothetical protein
MRKMMNSTANPMLRLESICFLLRLEFPYELRSTQHRSSAVYSQLYFESSISGLYGLCKCLEF